jgi:predicted esterase
MPTRREILIGAAALGFGAACSKSRKVTQSAHAGVDFKVLVPQEPDAAYPLVVAIHGIGGAPEHWVDGWRAFPGRAQIALPRGFDKHGEGFSWFPWSANMKDEKLAADVAAAEDRLWKGIADLAAGRRVVVAGYAQGAVLTYAIAARRPEILGAFPVAGACPEALFPKARAAPVIAFHGTKDDLLAIDLDRAAIEAFKRQGNRAELREYAGVGHDPSDKMHVELDAEMLKTLDAKS